MLSSEELFKLFTSLCDTIIQGMLSFLTKSNKNFWNDFMVFLSNDEKGSSNNKALGFEIIALRQAILAFWPPKAQMDNDLKIQPY